MKHISLAVAMARVKGLTQKQLEDASGVDRTWIAKLRVRSANTTLETYEGLDAALRRLGGLKRGEKLVFGPARKARRSATSHTGAKRTTPPTVEERVPA